MHSKMMLIRKQLKFHKVLFFKADYSFNVHNAYFFHNAYFKLALPISGYDMCANKKVFLQAKKMV